MGRDGHGGLPRAGRAAALSIIILATLLLLNSYGQSVAVQGVVRGCVARNHCWALNVLWSRRATHTASYYLTDRGIRHSLSKVPRSGLGATKIACGLDVFLSLQAPSSAGFVITPDSSAAMILAPHERRSQSVAGGWGCRFMAAPRTNRVS